MKKYIGDFRVLQNIRLNDEYYELVLHSPESLPTIRPGQFAEIRIDGSDTTFLRRPISFYDVDQDGGIIYLLIRIAGNGTRQLSGIKPDALINMIYPLGKSFSVPAGNRFLLVAGGVGIAPMLILGKWLRQQGREVIFLFGFRSERQYFPLDRFDTLGQVYVTTEDGSLGTKGLVTTHPVLEEEQVDGIYTCGPDPMMKAVAAIADRRNIFCEASLENTMACGFGACLCCAQQTTEGTKMICTDGPVFNTKSLIWQT